MSGPEGRAPGGAARGARPLALVALLAGGPALCGCAPALPERGSAVAATEAGEATEAAALAGAEQAWRGARVAEYRALWEEEGGAGGDPFSAGLAAYHLASLTREPEWSEAALEAFDRVLESRPGFALARAWRGSAHALRARDFPVRGILQLLPGPGFVRLAHVKASFSDLDAAAGAAPRDPSVRLLRAATRLGMPAIFGGTDEGLADFRRLEAWTRDPESNPEHADLLRSAGWRERYHLARARAMQGIGREADAARSWARVAETSEDPLLQELAKWHRSSLDASR